MLGLYSPFLWEQPTCRKRVPPAVLHQVRSLQCQPGPPEKGLPWFTTGSPRIFTTPLFACQQNFVPAVSFSRLSIFMDLWLLRKSTCDHVSQFSLGSKCQCLFHSYLYLEVSILALVARLLKERVHQLSASTVAMGPCCPQLQGTHVKILVVPPQPHLSWGKVVKAHLCPKEFSSLNCLLSTPLSTCSISQGSTRETTNRQHLLRNILQALTYTIAEANP